MQCGELYNFILRALLEMGEGIRVPNNTGEEKTGRENWAVALTVLPLSTPSVPAPPPL